MMNFFENFRKDEAGAVTVDWVVLTAAVVGLAVAAYSSIETGASSLTAEQRHSWTADPTVTPNTLPASSR